MAAYYNEIDPYAAQWLRNLIKEGLIADGEVDTRSIVDVRPVDLAGFTQCHFFAGLGGWAGALRLAGWSDHREVWTGSCPCQPFSLAGKQRGFADERHLWPFWRYLIAQRRPAKVYGEQVASASAWLGLVRGDLEALDYAVGAMPIEAASAGADHLRDRFWFVANSHGGRLGGPDICPQQPRGAETVRAGEDGNLGNSGRPGLALGSIAEVQRGDLRSEGAAVTVAGDRSLAVAHADQPGARQERQQRGRQLCGAGCYPQACDGLDLADACSNGAGCGAGCGAGDRTGAQGAAERIHWRASRSSAPPRLDGEDFEWVIGADGKARRVKPGIRLLAHGVPARVAKLRALGNAIDLRPAAAFIKATM